MSSTKTIGIIGGGPARSDDGNLCYHSQGWSPWTSSGLPSLSCGGNHRGPYDVDALRQLVDRCDVLRIENVDADGLDAK